MPAASMALITSGSSEAGPMVATIFVERMDVLNIKQRPHTKSPLLATGRLGARLTVARRTAFMGPRP